MSRASFSRAKSGITCAASDDRALPRAAGEDHDRIGLAARAAAPGTTAMLSAMRRPDLRLAVLPHLVACRSAPATSTPGRRQSASAMRGARRFGAGVHAAASGGERAASEERAGIGERCGMQAAPKYSGSALPFRAWPRPNFPSAIPAEPGVLGPALRRALRALGCGPRARRSCAAFVACASRARAACWCPGCGSALGRALPRRERLGRARHRLQPRGARRARARCSGPHANRVRYGGLLRADRRGAVRAGLRARLPVRAAAAAVARLGRARGASWSSPAGALAGFFFFDAGERGPPFPLASQAELDALLEPAFERVEDAPVADSIDGVPGQGALAGVAAAVIRALEEQRLRIGVAVLLVHVDRAAGLRQRALRRVLGRAPPPRGATRTRPAAPAGCRSRACGSGRTFSRPSRARTAK